MLDGNDETCWNSHQGSPQNILVELKQPAVIDTVQIMFQGGFSGNNCEFWVRRANSDKVEMHKAFYPENNNNMQVSD